MTTSGQPATPRPDYVVIRAAADLPDGFLPPELEGQWFSRADMPSAPGAADVSGHPEAVVASPTGEVEVREDGAVAEVYRVRP